jgi:hypothetical protein
MLARQFSRDLAGVWDTHKEIVRFKIGEGGGSGGSPITPDSTFIDVQGEGEQKTGLCSFSNGVAAVTGDGSCSFTTEFVANDWIKPGARTTGVPSVSPYAPGYPGTEYDEWGQIQSITDNNNIVLTAPYAGVSTPEDRPPMKATAAQGPLFVFRKALATSDVIFFSGLPAITEVTTLVAAAEANLDQLGNSPDFYEIGGFDEDGVMVFYCTFDVQTKVAGVQLVTIIQLVF